MQPESLEKKDIIEKGVSLLWLFVSGALLGAVIWSFTLGAGLDLNKTLSPSRLVPYQMSSNLFFWGGGILNSVFGLYGRKFLTPNKSAVFPFAVWSLVWLLLAYRLDSFQKPLTRWVFFTLPLAWFAARVWWGVC